MANTRVVSNLPYSDVDERCRLDLYLPSGPASSVLVWFHGGGLTEGDKKVGEPLGRMLARHGIASVMANYRLNPHAKFPAYLLDAANAVVWMSRHATEHGLDPKKIFIGGISAGAYLAAMLALDERYLRAEGLDPAVLRGCIILSAQVATHFKVREEKGLPTAGVVSDEAAPMYYVRKDTMPLLLMVAQDDIPNRLEENQLFLTALKNTGNTRVAFKLIPGRTHNTLDTQVSEPGDPVGEAMVEFLAQSSGSFDKLRMTESQ